METQEEKKQGRLHIFTKEIFKNIRLIILLLIALGLIYIFAANWSVAVEAFKAGFYNY